MGKGALPNGWRLCRWLLPDGIRLGESASIEVEVEAMTLLPAGPGASGRGPGLRAMEVGEGGMAGPGGSISKTKESPPCHQAPRSNRRQIRKDSEGAGLTHISWRRGPGKGQLFPKGLGVGVGPWRLAAEVD